MKFCFASIAVIKNFKIARKIMNFFPYFFYEILIISKITDLKKKKTIFRILVVLLVILTSYLTV